MATLRQLTKQRPNRPQPKWYLAKGTTAEEVYSSISIVEARALELAHSTALPQVVVDGNSYLKWITFPDATIYYNTSKREDDAWHDTN